MSEVKVPEGYKQTEVGVIPEDWGVSLLMDITIDMLQGINTAIDKPEYVYVGVPILKANNVIDQVISLNDADQISYKSYLKYNQRYSVKRNDFLFSNIGARLGTGALWESDITATFAWNVMRIIPDPRKVAPKFLAQLINSPKQSEKIQAQQSGSGMGFVPKATMQKLLLPLPKLIEQTAIATALSDVDNLIQSLEKLIAKKEAIKTGTMQQLLTGKTRLPEFATREDGSAKGFKQTELGQIPEDWEVIEFGKLLKEFRNGYSFSAKGYIKNGTPIITMSQIGLNGSFQYNTNEVKKWDASQFEHLKDFWVKDGDLLIAMTDVTPDKNLIGQMTIAELTHTALLNQRVGLLRLNKDLAQSNYLRYLSSLPLWRTYCKGVASLGVQANIGTKEIKQASVTLPLVEEQTAIATILSDIDTEIQALQQRLEKTKDIKQGMMQQLLTGKVRLLDSSAKSDTQTLASKGELQA